MCIKGIDFPSVYMIFLLDFCIVLMIWYVLGFPYITVQSCLNHCALLNVVPLQHYT